MSIYEYSIKKINSSEELDLKTLEGKKILFVNVASKCGFTPQYSDLQKLYQEHKEELTIIGLPCNQFLWQESGPEDSIQSFCQTKYQITFPLTEKISVKGKKQHPIYKWLTTKELNGKDSFKVTWNFHKFLVSENGELIDHFGAKIKPLDKKITKHLKKS